MLVDHSIATPTDLWMKYIGNINRNALAVDFN